MIKFFTDEAGEGVRIDIYIAENTEMTRSFVQKLIKGGGVYLNGGVKTEKNYKLRFGDEVSLDIPEPEETDIPPQDLEIGILYEDCDIIVVDKPRGMTVHPSGNMRRDTLVNALLHHCKGTLSGINGVLRPGIVHRLDKLTSGVMVAAKNDNAHRGLAEQIAAHTAERQYRAVLFGNLKDDSGTLDFPLGRSRKDFKKIAVYPLTDESEGIKRAITHYKVLDRAQKNGNSYTYASFKLETGRTHQIRVHAAHIGHPVVGDIVYGNAASNKNFTWLEGQCLHSKSLSFNHPVSGERLFIESGLPEYFKKALGFLEIGEI